MDCWGLLGTFIKKLHSLVDMQSKVSCVQKRLFSMLAPTVAVSFCAGWTVKVIRTYLYQLDCSYNACNASRNLGQYWLLKSIHTFV